MTTLKIDCEQYSTYTSQMCHFVKNIPTEEFISQIRTVDIRRLLFNDKKKEALFTIAITDYICKKNNISFVPEFDNFRNMKMEKLSYPDDVELYCSIVKDETEKQRILKNAIPEFLQYNIVESSITNVC